MGHDVSAGITANVAVAACRNARRQGASLTEASQTVERALLEQFGTQRHVTGILAELNIRTGGLSWVNRGHHLPLLVRDRRVSATLTCRSRRGPRRRGKRVRQGPLHRLRPSPPLGPLHPPRDPAPPHACRAEHNAGRLKDDATVLLVEWRGGHHDALTP
ncbi:SpoIIE family protein phosphatase [Streptomyces fragilis]|uniref:SpoIIE family protein phosphatase n=1 Tax=Streptomyces fragilis TaxID=67301 RepID=A0ABV2YF09_9ACTN|nr:SpoIIE family protein phosphatase [Streptomyces fragilis]